MGTKNPFAYKTYTVNSPIMRRVRIALYENHAIRNLDLTVQTWPYTGYSMETVYHVVWKPCYNKLGITAKYKKKKKYEEVL